MKGSDNLVVGVLVEITSKSVDRIFDYLVPKSLEDKIRDMPFSKIEKLYKMIEDYVNE